MVSEVKYGTSKSSAENGRYPYLRMNNITSDGYMDYTNMKSINIDDDEKEKYIVRKGDLLFNRTNSKELVGKTGIFNEDQEMVIAGYLIRVRTNERANPWYLWGYLNSSHGKKTLIGMCKAIVGMANINAQELQSIKILIPPIELQNKYSKIVEKTESLKAQYQSSLKELGNLYGSLSQRAFKGEITFKEKKLIELSEESKIDEKIEKKDRVEIEENIRKFKYENILLHSDIIPVPTYHSPEKSYYEIYRFIAKEFENEYFTFEELKEKLYEKGYKYDFESIKDDVFKLLRNKLLRQIFADASFKNSFDFTNPDYDKIQKLKERIYLTRSKIK